MTLVASAPTSVAGTCRAVALLIAVAARTHQMVQERHGTSAGVFPDGYQAALYCVCALTVGTSEQWAFLVIVSSVVYASVGGHGTVQCYQIRGSAEFGTKKHGFHSSSHCRLQPIFTN